MSELSITDRQAIEQVHDRWIAEEMVGNGAAVLCLCTKDVMWIPPGAPPLVGKDIIAQWLAGIDVEIKDLQITDLRINGNEGIAYLTSNYSTAYVAEDSGEMRRANGTHLWVLRKVLDGEWKVAIVTWSSWPTEP